MVMWMSRIEIKIENRKRKKKLRVCLFFIFIFMIIGVLSVDFALREMLALEETRVFGYELQPDHVVLYIVGEKVYIENERIEEMQTFIKVAYDSFKEQVNYIIEKIKNVEVNRHFFSNSTKNNYHQSWYYDIIYEVMDM